MHLENIMLSEINQSEKDKHYMISLYKMSKIVNLIAAENR